MGPAFIFQVSDLHKKFGQRELLKNVNLAFYPGAKIGLLGRNGAGKSTLMKIMAGIDKDFDGEARLAEGYTVGYLEQEPQLDLTKTVFENVMDAVDHSRAVLRRFEEINTRLGEPMSDGEMEKILAEQATVQDEIDAKNLWDLDRQVEIAMDAMNLPPGDWGVTNLSGGERRRVALCKLLLEKPDLLLLDEPTNHLDAESVNWLERHLAEYVGTVVAVTHDRGQVDPRGRSRSRDSFRGQLLVVAPAEEGPAGTRGKDGQRPPEDARQGTRVGADVSQGAAGQEQGPPGVV